MKRTHCLLCINCVVLVLMYSACDPISKKKLKVSLPSAGSNSQNLTFRIDAITGALNAIEDIAARHGMKKREVDQPKLKNMVRRAYLLQYSEAPSGRMSVSLDVEADAVTGNIIITIVDFFRFTGSDLSKEIECDLIDTIRAKFGDKSISAY